MKQLWFTGKNKLEWREVADPKIVHPHEAIVRPLAIARCDLDLPIIRGETLFRPSALPCPLPQTTAWAVKR